MGCRWENVLFLFLLSQYITMTSGNSQSRVFHWPGCEALWLLETVLDNNLHVIFQIKRWFVLYNIACNRMHANVVRAERKCDVYSKFWYLARAASAQGSHGSLKLIEFFFNFWKPGKLSAGCWKYLHLSWKLAKVFLWWRVLHLGCVITCRVCTPRYFTFVQ